METAQAKFGIRFILLVLFVVIVFVPILKVAAGKVTWLPEQVRSWVFSI